jgi:antitoxin (DNA-binding transcriptional repressor) of toxin-antitoxin stability system
VTVTVGGAVAADLIPARDGDLVDLVGVSTADCRVKDCAAA